MLLQLRDNTKRLLYNENGKQINQGPHLKLVLETVIVQLLLTSRQRWRVHLNFVYTHLHR